VYSHIRACQESDDLCVSHILDEDTLEGESDEDPTKSEFFSSELMFLISDAHPSNQLLQTKCGF